MVNDQPGPCARRACGRRGRASVRCRRSAGSSPRGWSARRPCIRRRHTASRAWSMRHAQRLAALLVGYLGPALQPVERRDFFLPSARMLVRTAVCVSRSRALGAACSCCRRSSRRMDLSRLWGGSAAARLTAWPRSAASVSCGGRPDQDVGVPDGGDPELRVGVTSPTRPRRGTRWGSAAASWPG